MKRTGFIVLAAVVGLSSAAHSGDCLKADAEAKTAGTLALESGAYVLTIGAPVCLEGTDAEDNVAATTRLQVFPGTEDVQKGLEGLVGKTVSITGSFYGSRTKKFNAPILVEVSAAQAQ